MDWLIDTAMEIDLESDEADDEEEIRRLNEMNEALEGAEQHDSQEETSTWRDYSLKQNDSLYTTEDLKLLSRIDASLSLNKLYDEKARRLERILHLRLRECRAKLNEIQVNSSQADKTEIFRYINCGKPYFRDAYNKTPPDNDDTVIMKAQMYDFSLITSVPGWTVRDKSQFTEVMTQISLEIKKDEYTDKILQLKNMVKETSKAKKNMDKEILQLRRERDRLNIKMKFSELALPLGEEYDWDMLANRLNKRHTPLEYKCLWKLYLHPSINKTNWGSSEHNKLQAIASAHNYQDWDTIAQQLNTGRTGYQCFVYYRTNITNICTGKKWTEEEVTYLRRLIDYFREENYIPWGKIAAAMENRTKIQIYNKYLRLIELRKGRFLPEEDAVILNCVERFGTNFRRMTEYLGHRSMVQIRTRYQVLSKMRISTVWTVEDDKKLIQLMSNTESNNMTFSLATKYFPGRNRVNLRSRYMTLVKWMKKHPNLDIEHAPRRGARRLSNGKASDNLNQAIEDLKNSLNTEVAVNTEKKNRAKLTLFSEETDIEQAIIAILVNEAVERERELKKSSYNEPFTLSNQMVVTKKDLNLANLRKCLIFLGSALDKDLFKKSHFRDEYPDLSSNQDICLVGIKSYSRKNNAISASSSSKPDVWGNNVLTERTYVLPPHYATITGCKALMSYLGSISAVVNSLNVHFIIRRNVKLKRLMDQLLERFYTLFLWPMLLSNEGPKSQ